MRDRLVRPASSFVPAPVKALRRTHADEGFRSPGEPLDAATRAYMAPRFGFDLASVRIHHDEEAQAAAKVVHARAFTVGQDIVVGPGEHRPGQPAWTRLLAHELSHVGQRAAAPGDPGAGLSRAGDPAEQEADLASERVAAGGAAPPLAAAPAAAVQRKDDGKEGAGPEGKDKTAERKPAPALPQGEQTITIFTDDFGAQTFGAEIDPKKCELTIRKRIWFDFQEAEDIDNFEDWGKGEQSPDKVAFVKGVIAEGARWSGKQVLVPDGECAAPCPLLAVRVEVMPVGESANYDTHAIVKKVKKDAKLNPTPRTGPGRDAHWYSTDTQSVVTTGTVMEVIGGREVKKDVPGELKQTPATHELGHTFGLSEVGGHGKYGAPGSEDEKSIMGKGMVFGPKSYATFVQAANTVTPCKWKVGDAPSSGLGPLGVLGILGGGAAAGAGIGLLAHLLSHGSIALGAGLGYGALIGLGVAGVALGIYGLSKLLS